MTMRSPYTYTVLRANTAKCALRPGVCPNVAFPWVQCRFEEHPAMRAYHENEDDDRDYLEVFAQIRKDHYIDKKPGVSFLKRGTGHGDPPERFPYRCLRSRPETHETHETHEKDDPS